MSVRYVGPAGEELLEAISYYEARVTGLGRRLFGEVQRAERLVSQFPKATTEVRPAVRRCLIRKFPYALIYTIQEQEIVVLAFAHLNRQPGYWKSQRP